MQPRTVEMYKFLGVLPDLQKVRVDSYPVFEFNSPQGNIDDTEGKSLPMVEHVENTPARPYVSIPRTPFVSSAYD